MCPLSLENHVLSFTSVKQYNDINDVFLKTFYNYFRTNLYNPNFRYLIYIKKFKMANCPPQETFTHLHFCCLFLSLTLFLVQRKNSNRSSNSNRPTKKISSFSMYDLRKKKPPTFNLCPPYPMMYFI